MKRIGRAAMTWMMGGMIAGAGMTAQGAQVFSEDFSGRGGLSKEWQISTWVNGHPFGCTFSNQDVSKTPGLLSLGFSGNSGKCAEVRTQKFWQYGTYIVDMKPANVPGSVSSFFLYAGQSTKESHYEVDIEFLGGKGILHTNYWVQGEQYPQDIDLTALGINPFEKSRKYSFVWQPDSIAWYVMTDAKQWKEVRRVAVNLATPMQVMMNAWYGDNADTALYFPGFYDGTPGVAEYRSVWIGQ